MTDVIETTKVVGNSILVSMDVTSLHRRKEVLLYAKHTKPIPRRHARTYPKGELFPICWENYLQVQGTAMETKAAIAFANIFMWKMETEIGTQSPYKLL